MRETFVKTLIELAQTNKNLVLITGDLGYNVLKPYWELFPKQFYNVGIAEQSMTGIACGMALEDHVVFTYSIANFPSLRCLEQIRNDCAYHKANVKIVSIGSGFSYGASGMSHHGTEDLAILRSLPDVTIFSPCDPIETNMVTKLAYSHPGTCYLRLGKGGEKCIHEQKIDPSRYWNAQHLINGEKIVVFSTGGITIEAKSAVIELRKLGLDVGLISFPIIKPIDEASIINSACKANLIVTIEEHTILGGFGGSVAEVISGLKNHPGRLLRIGIKDQYSTIVGSQEYLRNLFQLSSQGIMNQILDELSQT